MNREQKGRIFALILTLVVLVLTSATPFRARAADTFNIVDQALYPVTYGTATQCWTSNGPSAIPSWQACGGGGGMSIGGTVTSGTPTNLLYVGAGPVLAQASGLTISGGNTLTVSNELVLAGAAGMHFSVFGNQYVQTTATDTFRLSNSATDSFVTLVIDASNKLRITNPTAISTGAAPNQFRLLQTTAPTCATNCGTSPTLAGSDAAMTVTMGATGSPASGFIITFNGTWPSAPSCVGAMAKTGMVAAKLPLTLVTSQTTLTVVTNGTAPANTDVYHFHCIGTS